MKDTFRTNNFDLIRLLAALQVAVNHSFFYLQIDRNNSLLLWLSTFFPGVPVFFFISGFLISRSFETNPTLQEYSLNRVLRIYPALVACTIIGLFSVYLTGYLESKGISLIEYLVWITGQLTIIQFYNPEFMRDFGTGVLNGSLWTISVELQFYIITPLIYWIFKLRRSDKNLVLSILILLFMLFHVLKYTIPESFSESFLVKLYGVSFIPWIYMFLLGVLFQKNFAALHRLLSGKVLFLLPAYLLLSYVSRRFLGWPLGNEVHPLLFLLLAATIFSAAFSFPTLSGRIFKGNDISYGIYIYHIPIINLFLYYGLTADISYFYLTITLTAVLASLSWLLVEKQCIRLKRHPLNPMRHK